jgi:hypothetical protein
VGVLRRLPTCRSSRRSAVMSNLLGDIRRGFWQCLRGQIKIQNLLESQCVGTCVPTHGGIRRGSAFAQDQKNISRETARMHCPVSAPDSTRAASRAAVRLRSTSKCTRVQTIRFRHLSICPYCFPRTGVASLYCPQDRAGTEVQKQYSVY